MLRGGRLSMPYPYGQYIVCCGSRCGSISPLPPPGLAFFIFHCPLYCDLRGCVQLQHTAWCVRNTLKLSSCTVVPFAARERHRPQCAVAKFGESGLLENEPTAPADSRHTPHAKFSRGVGGGAIADCGGAARGPGPYLFRCRRHPTSILQCAWHCHCGTLAHVAVPSRSAQ